MSTEAQGLVIQYNVTDGAIAEIAEKFKDAEADTPDGYKHVVAGIRTTRELRGEVEARRVELKQDALVYGRRVDAEAKRINESLFAIEIPLKGLKATIDDEKTRLKREAAEKRKAEEREKLEAEAAEKRAAEKLEREKQEKHLQEQQRQIDEERQALEKRQAEEQQKRELEERQAREKRELEDRERQARADKEQQERNARMAEERKAREAEEAELTRKRLELEKAEQERLARERAEAEQKSLAAEEERRQKREADEANKREVERLELEKRRQAALPDVDKLTDFVCRLQAIQDPSVTSPSGIAVLGQINRKLGDAAKLVADFAKELES